MHTRQLTISLLAGLFVVTRAAAMAPLDRRAAGPPESNVVTLDPPPPGEPYPLDEVPWSRGTILLDPALASCAEDIVAAFDAWADALDGNAAAGARLIEHLTAIREASAQLVGLEHEDPRLVLAARGFAKTLGLMSRVAPPRSGAVFRVCAAERTKAYLRAGGSIPRVVYYPEDDRATAEFFELFDDSGDAGDFTIDGFTFPVSEASPVVQLRSYLDLLTRLLGMNDFPVAGMLAHELVEVGILARLGVAGPHRRWFCDGFATALGVEALRRIGLDDDAAALELACASAPYSDLVQSAHLEWWLAVEYEVPPPTARERRLQQARYAFAFDEARHIVEAHGPGVLDAVLDRLEPNDVVLERDIRAAIVEETGVDVGARLSRYRRAGPREAFAAAKSEVMEAVERDDGERALEAGLRILEIAPLGRFDARNYGQVAERFVALGRTDDAVVVMQRMLAAAVLGGPEARTAALWMLLARAVTWNRVELAYEAADELAAETPTDPAIALVRTHRLAAQGRTAAAATIASKIRGEIQVPALLALADQIIAADPHAGVWRSIIDEADPERDAVAGEWLRVQESIVCNTGRFVRLAVPVEIPASYELEILCSRIDGEGSINIILPVADRSVLVVLDGWPERNGLSALDRVRGRDGPNNATRTTAFRLRGLPIKHHVHISVRVDGDDAAIDVVTDGVVLIAWAGPVTDLSLLENWSLGAGAPKLGLGAYSARAIFQSLRIRPIE